MCDRNAEVSSPRPTPRSRRLRLLAAELRLELGEQTRSDRPLRRRQRARARERGAAPRREVRGDATRGEGVRRERDVRVDARVGGWLGSAFNGGECVAVEAYARTRLDVALYQEPHAVRQGEAGAATALDLGCAVVKCASRSDRAVAGDDPRTHRLVAAAPRVAHRAGAACHLTLEHDDDPTTRYLVVPLCFGHRHSVEPRRFRAVVHSDLVCEVGVVSCEPSVVAAALAQIAEDSGKRAPLLEDSLKRPIDEILTIEDEAGIASSPSTMVQIRC